MRAFARFRLPDDTTIELGHGDLIGRLWSATLHIDDPRVSEAHAMVSLRGDALKLLALRGRFTVDTVPTAEVALAPGMRIALAQDLELTVDAVNLPDELLAIEGEGLTRQVVSGVCALVTRPRPALLPGYHADAAATFWTSGAGWRVRLAGEPARALAPDDVFELDGRTFRCVGVQLSAAAGGATRVKGGVSSPLRIVARYETVHIHRRDQPVMALNGISARILSELVTFGVPVAWDVLAGEIWPDEPDRDQLRRRWDVSLARLRRKLRDSRIRPDLVRADRGGNFEVVLGAGDRVDDQT